MQTFFSAADYVRYRELVADGCRAADVQVLAYCLMPNHVHLILVPGEADGLNRALASPQQKYTWAINRRQGWQGHLWQRRFSSCPMDEPHTLAAIRYVELNPVRAGLVSTPEQWPWSSTRARIGGTSDGLVTAERPAVAASADDWLEFLAAGIDGDAAECLRRYQRLGLPLGSESFVARLERAAGTGLRPKARGRPKLGTATISLR